MKKYTLHVIALMGVVVFVRQDLWSFRDFELVFYPVLSLQNPYQHGGFFNAPWLVTFLWPLRLLTYDYAVTLWMTVSIVIVGYTVYKLNGDVLAYVLIFSNPFFFIFMTKANIEAIILLGYIAPQPLDIILMSIKPHMLFPVIVNRLRTLSWLAWWMLLSVVLLSLIVYGFWPIYVFGNTQSGGLYTPTSVDIFPLGVLAGIVILYLSWIHGDEVGMALSSYLFLPYVSSNSVFIYAVLIFTTFTTRHRLLLYAGMWAIMFTGFYVI